ncbi:LOW QUALITY PROTEIN: uncharacterized protein C7orf31-like [Pecten maximus]|uniref:LOW QUALITY PROTEIN: uncharacterized protein C7orf31-like n=1 Tax=Pecten maximus TaxID=6579 RepID=UPI00145919AD|nr:LOW QUALITY PROTEIN: uncharacterized protein C7orf31-like [Pecten maximus]
MTSIQLFPNVEHNPVVPKEWGSGKLKEDVNVYIPGPPTWQYKGDPIDQFYTLTKLKLSNVRSNDALLSKPQEAPMGEILINKDFPAEHPYSSHMPRYSLFPKFDSPEDPKRGVAARRVQPINAEMPATAHDVTILHKSKGHGHRQEVETIPKESEKRALEWSGEHGFNQLVKTHGGRQQFYPIPPKTVAPNLQNRWTDMKVSDRTANALRNIERNQWHTTYDLNHTGLGPANPLKLDNIDDKYAKYEATGLEDDTLYPRSINTIDPPRPIEGRISKMLIPKPPNQKPDKCGDQNTGYVRMMTHHEKEEDRLWNGKEYVNLPNTSKAASKQHKTLRWKELNDEAHPQVNIDKLNETTDGEFPDDIPYVPTVGVPERTEEDYLTTTKVRKDKDIQEMEAQNRFKVLEAQTPGHELTALNCKYQHLTDKEMPSTFYSHEGKYNEERAGMYRTSYHPERLSNSLSGQERSPPEIMNTMHSHVDALNLPTKLNRDMKDALRYSRTLNSSMPNLAGDMRDAYEVLTPLHHVKEAQKMMLQPTEDTARVPVLEKEMILKESVTGNSYNTHKFLQENQLPKFARQEPLNVMSTENQNLANVRLISGLKPQKSVSFSDSVTVASGDENGNVRIISAPSRMQRGAEKENIPPGNICTTQYTSTQALYNPFNEQEVPPQQEPSIFELQMKALAEEREMERQLEKKETPTMSVRQPRRRAATSLDTEYHDEYRSLSSNIAPTNLRHSMQFSTAYQNQFPNYHDLTYKQDPRFMWEPGFGSPRPQTDLVKMQDRFSKSSVRKKFHSCFSESNPDLRENIISGKKHTFFGMNAQNLHG